MIVQTEVPATFTAFRRWRLKQMFATEELATRAYLIECDLHILSKVPHIKSIVAHARQNVAEFERALTNG
jgi:hypothetical protein